jgi:hypothetical protein
MSEIFENMRVYVANKVQLVVSESKIDEQETSSEKRTEEWKRGFRAYESGMDETDNPFVKGEGDIDGPKAGDWVDGYAYALQLRQDEEGVDPGDDERAEAEDIVKKYNESTVKEGKDIIGPHQLVKKLLNPDTRASAEENLKKKYNWTDADITAFLKFWKTGELLTNESKIDEQESIEIWQVESWKLKGKKDEKGNWSKYSIENTKTGVGDSPIIYSKSLNVVYDNPYVIPKNIKGRVARTLVANELEKKKRSKNESKIDEQGGLDTVEARGLETYITNTGALWKTLEDKYLPMVQAGDSKKVVAGRMMSFVKKAIPGYKKEFPEETADMLFSNATCSRVALELDDALQDVINDRTIKNESKIDEAENIQTIFDINDVKEKLENIKSAIHAPHVFAQYSTLGGEENVSIILKISLDPKDTWGNQIYHNSRFLILHLNRKGTLSVAAKSHKLKKFRKTQVKNIQGAISKINAFIEKEDAPVKSVEERKHQTADEDYLVKEIEGLEKQTPKTSLGKKMSASRLQKLKQDLEYIRKNLGKKNEGKEVGADWEYLKHITGNPQLKPGNHIHSESHNKAGVIKHIVNWGDSDRFVHKKETVNVLFDDQDEGDKLWVLDPSDVKLIDKSKIKNESKIDETVGTGQLKAELVKYAVDILNKFKNADISLDDKYIPGYVMKIFTYMGFDEDNPNYSKFKKYFPSTYNKAFFSGSGSMSDIPYFSLTDAEKHTVVRKALKKVVEGKEERGKRDGTGPHKDSAQASISKIGKRKEAGEECEVEESREATVKATGEKGTVVGWRLMQGGKEDPKTGKYITLEINGTKKEFKQHEIEEKCKGDTAEEKKWKAIAKAEKEKSKNESEVNEVLGYRLSSADAKLIKAFVKGAEDGETKNLYIEKSGSNYILTSSWGTRGTRDSSGKIHLGRADGNVSQTFVNAIRKAAKAEGVLAEAVKEQCYIREGNIGDLAQRLSESIVEEENMSETELDREDAIMSPSGYLGSKISVSIEGKHIGEYDSEDDAENAIKAWMKKNKFYPNVWYIDDHGGSHLRVIETSASESLMKGEE